MRLSALAVLALLCAGTVPAREESGELPAASPEIRYVGRTETTGGSVSFDWSGTYFECRFTGGSLAVRVSDTKRNYYNLTLDGHDAGIVATFGTDSLVVLAEGLGEGEHTLRMQKRTEGEQGRTTLHAFRLARNGRLLPAPPSPGRHIEFIGNSLTCGYGTEGKDRNEPFKLETENCNLSFSTIVSRYFDADYTLVAHSGRGAVRNYGDTVRVSAVTMREKMLQTFDEGSKEQWDFKAYTPDLVVINLGTNDFSVEPKPFKSEFVASYTKILKQLRQHYGDVPILCIYCCTIPAPVYDYYETALVEMNDKNIHLLQMKKDLFNTEADYGAVWHPNYNGQRKMAMEIIPMVSTITGWELSGKAVE